MIVVLADDLSGAAELAGLATRHGLTAEVQTRFEPASTAEVICVDTDTRLRPETEAVQIVTEVTRRIMATKPVWIFKKCDSVLRGPVLAEALAVTRTTGLARCVIMPANPSRDRIIRRGRYYVSGRGLTETPFGHDPAHPRTTDLVSQLLGRDLSMVDLPDATTLEDISRLAAALKPTTLPVGAADFFHALLRHRVLNPPRVGAVSTLPVGPTLHVCGSATVWPQRQQAARALGRPVFALPLDSAAIVASLRQGGTVLVGIGDSPATQGRTPAELLAELARTAGEVLHQTLVTGLLLEGGATAAAVVQSTGWIRLQTLLAPADGVGVLRPVGAATPVLCIKPGSYPWPEIIG